MSQIGAVDVQHQRHMNSSEKQNPPKRVFSDLSEFPSMPSWRWSIFLILSASCASEWV